MANKRVFLVGGGALTVYQPSGRGFAEPWVFKADEEGLTQFAVYLEESSPSPVYLLVDFVEEEFREETIPHVFASDRRALIANKRNRLFRDTTYTHAMIQGREATGRRDDRVLFTALIRPDLLGPWLGQIARHKVPLAGIYSLPLLSQTLIKKIPINASHAVVITMHSTGGLRQTFFHQQQLRISRLAVTPRLGRAQYATYILNEAEKLRRYLGSLRLLAHDSPLDVFVLSHGDVLADLRAKASDTYTTRNHLIDLDEVARGTGLKAGVDSPYADKLFAQILLHGSPPNHYARAEDTRYFTMHRARLGMRVAAVLTLTVAIVMSAFQFAETVIHDEQANVLARQARFYAERYDRAKLRLPDAPASGQNIKAAVEMAALLKTYRTTPLETMAVLGYALDAYPKLQLNGIEWAAGTDPSAAFDGEKGVKATRRSGRDSRSDDSARIDLYHLARIKGSVSPFDGDYRAAIEMVEGFVDTLSKHRSVHAVRLRKRPLDVSSERALRGDAGATTKGAKADFELSLVVRVTDRAAGKDEDAKAGRGA